MRENKKSRRVLDLEQGVPYSEDEVEDEDAIEEGFEHQESREDIDEDDKACEDDGATAVAASAALDTSTPPTISSSTTVMSAATAEFKTPSGHSAMTSLKQPQVALPASQTLVVDQHVDESRYLPHQEHLREDLRGCESNE
ncbi:hypothetical protein EIP86_002453 [Pleurotus ostreatoroseus]|nr:hypothetical protein EIP86_002453 [Pleurotus ostreatoroseus]